MRKFAGILAFAAVAAFIASGCDNREEEELKKQIQMQIDLIEREIAAVEQHQEAMRAMIEDMQSRIDLMQEELRKEAPRIHAANLHIDALRSLTKFGLGESPAEAVAKEPAWSWWNALWVTLFVFILWLLYRVMKRRTDNP